MTEIYKDIPGFEGFYQIGNLGNVKSLPRRVINRPIHGRILKTQVTKKGYITVTLNKNSKKTSRLVHNIVAVAFVENPENLKEVNHVDGIKSNNKSGNLEWSTRSENILHAFRLGLIKRAFGKANKKSKPVLQYSLNGIFIKEYESANIAARELNINFGNICSVCRGDRVKAANFIWKYKSLIVSQ
jgi:hypothetical protein